jgi:hypothetical protein
MSIKFERVDFSEAYIVRCDMVLIYCTKPSGSNEYVTKMKGNRERWP